MDRKNQPASAPEQLELRVSARYLNIDQVAAVLSVPKSFVYRRTARGHDDPIPHYRFGGHLRFKLEDVETWIEEHRREREPQSPNALVAAALERATARSTKRVRRGPVQRRPQ